MSFGFGVGDFLAAGGLIIKTIEKFKEGEESFERFKGLEEQLQVLEETLIACREETSGFDLSAHGTSIMVKNAVADMGQIIGFCEEAIIQFRREMAKYIGLDTVGYSLNPSTSAIAGAASPIGRIKGKLCSVKRRLNITGDLAAAASLLEERLRGYLTSYELKSKLVQNIISRNTARQQEIQLCGVSKNLAGLQGQVERIGTEIVETQVSAVEVVREDILGVRMGVENLTEFMAALAVMLSTSMSSTSTAIENSIPLADEVRAAATIPPPPAYSRFENEHTQNELGYKGNMQIAITRRGGPSSYLHDTSSTTSRIMLNDSQLQGRCEDGLFMTTHEVEALAALERNAAIEPKLKSLLLESFYAFLRVVTRCLELFSQARVPQGIGYTWNNETGRLTSIKFLDALGGSFDLPQELCDSLSKLHGTLEVYFSDKRGYNKVRNKEYCIADEYEDGSTRIETDLDLLNARRPGRSTKLSMFMEVTKQVSARVSGTLGRDDIQTCPQCGAANYKTSGIRESSAGNAPSMFMNCISCKSDVRIFKRDSPRWHESETAIGPQQPLIEDVEHVYYKRVFVTEFKDRYYPKHRKLVSPLSIEAYMRKHMQDLRDGRLVHWGAWV